MKGTSIASTELLVEFANAGGTIRFGIQVTSSGQIQAIDDGPSASVVSTVTPVPNVTDGNWQKLDFVRHSSTERVLYADGVSVYSDTTDAGSLSDSGNLPLAVGIYPDGSTSPALTTKLCLVRLSATAPNAAQIWRMYESERRMFEANAKCLLQSGTTDAVLDVSIDPITGKVGVVQTDDEVLFDGLVIDEEPALPAGGANWEHVARYGGDRLVITNANLYADIAAKDIREEIEELRGMVSGLPKGTDLSRAKAWAYVASDGTINASYNIRSVSKTTGDYTLTFEVPFKSAPVQIASVSGNTLYIKTEPPASGSPGQGRVRIWNTSPTAADAAFYYVCYGELENE